MLHRILLHYACGDPDINCVLGVREAAALLSSRLYASAGAMTGTQRVLQLQEECLIVDILVARVVT